MATDQCPSTFEELDSVVPSMPRNPEAEENNKILFHSHKPRGRQQFAGDNDNFMDPISFLLCDDSDRIPLLDEDEDSVPFYQVVPDIDTETDSKDSKNKEDSPERKRRENLRESYSLDSTLSLNPPSFASLLNSSDPPQHSSSSDTKPGNPSSESQSIRNGLSTRTISIVSKGTKRVSSQSQLPSSIANLLNSRKNYKTEVESKRPKIVSSNSATLPKNLENRMGLIDPMTLDVPSDSSKTTSFPFFRSLSFKPLIIQVTRINVNLPIKSTAGLRALEKRVDEDPKVREALYDRLSRVNGTDSASCIQRILNTLVTPELRRQMDWADSQDKINFGRSAMKKVAFDAVRFHFSQATNSQLDQVAKIWCREQN